MDPKHIRLLQINLNTDKRAMDLLSQTIRQNKIDIAILTEPNKKFVSSTKWYTDELSVAAIGIFADDLPVKEHGSETGIVYVKINNLTIYCCYASPKLNPMDFGKYLEKITKISKHDGNKIFAGDYNAKASDWGETKTDRKGLLMREFIAQNRLIIQNTGNTPTFERFQSSSIIDLTLSSESLAGKVKNWHVMEEESLSDHKYIYFEIERQRTIERVETSIPRWNLKHIKINKFSEKFRELAKVDTEQT